MNECIYCKSTDIEKDLPIVTRGHNNWPTAVGPYFSFEKKKFLGMMQNHCKLEPMFIDLCKQCGGIKFHVKNANQDWQKAFPSTKDGVVFV
jgi:hypothetical protein